MTVLEGYSLALPATQQVRSEVDLTALVETHAALLFRVTHSILRNRAEAEDAVQDTFLRVLQHRHKLAQIPPRPLRPSRLPYSQPKLSQNTANA